MELISFLIEFYLKYFSALFKIAIFNGSYADFREQEDFENTFMVILCTICAALASGLTIGLMAFDSTKLEIKKMIGAPNEVAAAKNILPLVKKHHLLLVTLLLFNACATESMPIFLGALVPDWVAIIISVTLVLLFGEIVPASIFTGPKQLQVASSLSGLVRLLMVILYPIAFPISKLLDYFFGVEEESPNIPRLELEAWMKLQNTSNISDNIDDLQINDLIITPVSESRVIDVKLKGIDRRDSERLSATPTTTSTSDRLTRQEVELLSGVLKLTNVKVRDLMIAMGRIFSISAETKLDERSLSSILNRGFSRIPVYHRRDKQHIIGFLLVKVLVVVNPSDKRPVRSLSLREPLVVSPNLGLLEILKLFQVGRSHLALVSENAVSALECLRKGLRPPPDAQYIGLVTLEDVLEKIIANDIADETDNPNASTSLALDSEDGPGDYYSSSSNTAPSTSNTAPSSSKEESFVSMMPKKPQSQFVRSVAGRINFAKPNSDLSSWTAGTDHQLSRNIKDELATRRQRSTTPAGRHSRSGVADSENTSLLREKKHPRSTSEGNILQIYSDLIGKSNTPLKGNYMAISSAHQV